jgi:hypothetical protein
MPTYICKTPGCGQDLTAEVMRKLMTEGVQMRTALPHDPDPVIVKCANGHVHLYP